jgi:hypothetical protein
MHDDKLVERLRRTIPTVCNGGSVEDRPVNPDGPEAADRIETLSNTPAQGEAVAWRYTGDDGSVELVLDCNGEYARRLIELGYTEEPLFTALTQAPAPVDRGVLRQAAQEVLGWLETGFVECDHCGHEVATENMDAVWRLKQGLATLSPATPTEDGGK